MGKSGVRRRTQRLVIIVTLLKNNLPTRRTKIQNHINETDNNKHAQNHDDSRGLNREIIKT